MTARPHVGFTKMVDGTAEDYQLLGGLEEGAAWLP